MTEKLLQFIWAHRYFNYIALQLESGEPVEIIFPGFDNRNQGPDFLHARIRIKETIWIGHIELHLKTSHWNDHQHSRDANYDSVILHVVWEHDAAVKNRNLPTLVLQDRVPLILLEKYRAWMGSLSFVPCQQHIAQINAGTWTPWMQRLTTERMQRKMVLISNLLRQNNDHWEETVWWLMASNFGIRVNAGAFESIARTLPVSILARHKHQLPQLEALLFGQAGLLNRTFKDGYAQHLQKEYVFLKKKYRLPEVYERMHFLRMRPVNFPTIRLSQLAALIHQSSHLFSKIKETASVGQLYEMLSVSASPYWDDHYVFDEEAASIKKAMGRQMTENIIINTVAPLLFAYGNLKSESKYADRALEWLKLTGTEKK